MSSNPTRRLIKPKPLPKNGTIAVTAPATTPDSTQLERGVRYLESAGYQVIVGKSCYEKFDYLAGADALRASELMDLFCDNRVDAIFCARGGYGGMHLLPLLDYSRIARNPKLFVGFSDTTSLQWAFLAQCNLITVSGGMVASDMGKEEVNPAFEAAFWDFLDTGLLDITLKHTSPNRLNIEGTLLPGTLSVAAKQMGSPWFPDLNDRILVFEDVDEPCHKIEGYLRQFLLSGNLAKSRALIAASFSAPDKESFPDVPQIDTIVSRVMEICDLPWASGIAYGHIPNKISLPVGAPICLSLGPVTTLRSIGSIFAI